MNILIAVIWIGLSIAAIAIDDRIARWNGLSKILMITSLIALIYNGWQLYDPAQTRLNGLIDMNPTFTRALILSILEGICITGPIAAIHALQDWLYYEKHININPFRKER